ncbi:hypothetical protein TRICHSKD4_2395 [Roseibium sp. TrichSKD4]|uniref:phage regulatory CII family protein n=1 Tax=Roseibium sp. TrichSKD4 TaxID=744980 RepID=UPI0001E56B03|nr:phage regulatory CII family protein [Roseibium sp. TrichSKD4]EFO32593.1 hypothetical protein TRICHSKD4_2395 [Roseibium sp. TrichSKD4]
MMVRPTTEHDRRALKTSVRSTLRAAGSQTEAEQATRVSQQTLSTYGSTNPRHADCHMPIDIVMDLVMDTHDTSILNTMCRLAHGVFVPFQNCTKRPTAWTQGLSEVVRKGAEVSERVLKALEDDGEISPEEVRDYKMIDAIDGNIQALLMIRARLLEVSEKGGGQ